MSERYVTMRPLKELVREKRIKIEHISDDGEYVRFKILPNGPIVGQSVPRGPQLVVNCETVHENELKMMPWAFLESSPLSKDGDK